MKKIYLVIFTVFLNLAAFSCSPESVTSDSVEPVACCDEDGPILPPPPNGGGD